MQRVLKGVPSVLTLYLVDVASLRLEKAQKCPEVVAPDIFSVS
jgi:hypothetical protein